MSLQESTDLNLQEKLFGDADSVYVARDQLVDLGNLLNSQFNIIEDYQITGEQFSNEFVDNIIALVGEEMKSVDIEAALESLSKFSFQADLKPDLIKNDLSKFFKIEKTENKERIVFDDKFNKDLDKQSSSVAKGAGSMDLKGMGAMNLIGFTASGSGENNKSEKLHSINSGSNLNDQLKELNSLKDNQVTFEISGERIVPKSLKVAKLHRVKFNKNLCFSRIRKVYVDAEFKKEFSLSTQNVLKNPEFVNVLTNNIKALESSASVNDSNLNNLIQQLVESSGRIDAMEKKIWPKFVRIVLRFNL